MDIERIIKELSVYQKGQLPKEALSQAIIQQETITPLLLAHLEKQVGRIKQAVEEQNILDLYSVYLLAQFQEKRAYPIIVKLVSGPDDTAYDLLGDCITEDLGRILASMFDGDTGLVEQMIEDDSLDDFVRSAGLRTLAILHYQNRISREWLLGYCTGLYAGKIKKTNGYIWDCLAFICENMGFTELLEDMERSYRAGLTEEDFSEFEYLKRQMLKEVSSKERMKKRMGRDAEPVNDVVSELKTWASFLPEQPTPSRSSNTQPTEPRPYIPGIKVGRNEPCPCGSGKKYKKCCGR